MHLMQFDISSLVFSGYLRLQHKSYTISEAGPVVK
jgi:hypothetical protein